MGILQAKFVPDKATASNRPDLHLRHRASLAAAEEAGAGQEALLAAVVEREHAAAARYASMISCVCFHASNWLALI
ncbi:hypothetical protein M2310_007287 [Rhizobium leguminosarum]|nr:hypothetical protein [Rhizobium leguminosarum]